MCVILMALAFLLCSQLSLDVSAKRVSPAILSVQFLFVFFFFLLHCVPNWILGLSKDYFCS